MSPRTDYYTAVRIPTRLAYEVDRLIPSFYGLPDFILEGYLSRSVVIRVALARGLALLEKEAASPPTAKKRP